MNFKVSYYLRSNYKNKEGKSPVMLRIFLNSELMNLGSTKIFVSASKWSNSTSRLKGRTHEALGVNARLGQIESQLMNIFEEHKNDDMLTLDRIKSIYLGKDREFRSFLPIFDLFIEEVAAKVENKKLSKESMQKYTVLRRHFAEFLKIKYERDDITLTEFTGSVIHDFEIYLLTVVKLASNTTTKKLKTLKTITLYADKRGLLPIDPFANHRFHLKPTDRGFLTDNEIMRISKKDFTKIPRLDFVRDMFIFSCFTGLAYIDVANLKPENVVLLDDKEWIMTKRQKTSVEANILLLDIPKKIIKKYSHTSYKDGKLFPILSNQKMNAYLKEIGDLCGIKKKLTYHLARHTFATMSLSKGVPMESVSKMLGHTNIKTTQIYARITNKKVEHDMEELASKLGKFNDNFASNPIK